MNVWIEWKYKTAKNLELTLTTEVMQAKKALLIAEDFMKTGRTKDLVFYDEQHTMWTKKEFEKLLKEVEEEPHHIEVFFDGGFDVQTKKAGAGVAIYYSRKNKDFRIRENSVLEELDNNNEAEYAAFWAGVLQLEALGVRNTSVHFKGDSQVVLNQLSGEWPCFEDEFNRWLDRIEEKLKELKIKPTYTAISRKENREADQLASQALQGVMVSSHLNRSE
ncbi:ribonuclease HI [Bacillus mesophilus]|uniref:Reverse transcriptase-like protein n=1 Tax=Bacillus mesophilus TaxID=1808955 RepID=A0A6M0QDL8_9BACI|nr:ribonuclease HI [Bacillus mesophilus]NEY73909.1 reverse transcriptase-like protein [Bacillus mesophilus]